MCAPAVKLLQPGGVNNCVVWLIVSKIGLMRLSRGGADLVRLQ